MFQYEVRQSHKAAAHTIMSLLWIALVAVCQGIAVLGGSHGQAPPVNLPSRLRAIFAMRLLLSSSTFKRGRRGKPSNRTMALSDRSMLSNWSCEGNNKVTRKHKC